MPTTPLQRSMTLHPMRTTSDHGWWYIMLADKVLVIKQSNYRSGHVTGNTPLGSYWARWAVRDTWSDHMTCNSLFGPSWAIGTLREAKSDQSISHIKPYYLYGGSNSNYLKSTRRQRLKVNCTEAEEPSLSYYLPIAGGRIIGFIPFPRVLVLCEMQSFSSRIWTRVAVSISYDDNHYTTGTS